MALFFKTDGNIPKLVNEKENLLKVFRLVKLMVLCIAAIWVSVSTPQEFIRREIQSKLRLTDSVQCVFECHRSLMSSESIVSN